MTRSIVLDFEGIKVPVTLNDTETACAFYEKLPVSIEVSGTGIDFCGRMPFELPYLHEQVGRGWKNGDVNYNPGGGWFAVLYADEENSLRYGDQVNIGRIDGPVDAVSSLHGAFNLRIEKAWFLQKGNQHV